jgi:hypothetical protein
LQLTEYPVTILGLLDDYEEEEGLLCKADQQGQSVELPLADLILKGHGRNRQLVEDYGYWFCNYWGSDEGDYDSSSEVIYSDSQGSLAGRGSFFGLLLKFGFEGAMAGVVLGMTLTTVPWAPIGAGVGLVLGSLILGVTGGKEGRTGGMVHGSVIGSVFGAVIGGGMGSTLGAILPTLIVSWQGALLGGMVGFGIGWVLSIAMKRSIRPVFDTFWGAAAGALLLTFYQNPEQAGIGALFGLLAGAVAASSLFLGLLGIMYLVGRGQRGIDQ